MKVISDIKEMADIVTASRSPESGLTGFVPTMGYLHDGHLSLIRAARKECGLVFMSIFVNPAQFGPGEDLDSYPRDLQRDTRIASDEGVDAVFAPRAEDMYGAGYSTFIEVTGRLSSIMCGSARPGHFRGVTTVVGKLFNIIRPDKAYFGQKDYQQAVIIKKMALELNTGIQIEVLPIIREEDGLAMSSRNKYLTSEERERAIVINRALSEAALNIREAAPGLPVKEKIRALVKKRAGDAGIRTEYVEVLDAEGLLPLNERTAKIITAFAGYVGNTRLIDNIIVDIK
jgi:pantoate--beta-alanine ligase